MIGRPPRFEQGPVSAPVHQSRRTWSLSAAAPSPVRPPQPAHSEAKAGGSTMVALSCTVTAGKRCNNGSATGSAATTCWTATSSTVRRHAAA
jgi:hypothetical protein